MDLKLKDKEILIGGVGLPRSFQISLEKRGKTAVNHRYVEDVRELQIFVQIAVHGIQCTV